MYPRHDMNFMGRFPPQQMPQPNMLLTQQVQAAAAVAAAVNKQTNSSSASPAERPVQAAQPAQSQKPQESSPQNASESPKALNDEKVYGWIVELANGPNKEEALLELGRRREFYDDLALVLWNSFGVMTALVEEIVAVYPYISPPSLTSQASNRVCNALALTQCIASHPDTRMAFLRSQIPLFLYPFLNTTSPQKSFEYLRLTSLGVIGALVKNDSPEVIQFLLTTEVIPLLLKIMETPSDLSQTVAIFVVQKILMDKSGFAYVCFSRERFIAVTDVLKKMVEQLVETPKSRLLRHVIRCYLRLADNHDASMILKSELPQQLRDHTFDAALANDASAKSNLSQLLYTVMK